MQGLRHMLKGEKISTEGAKHHNSGRESGRLNKSMDINVVVQADHHTDGQQCCFKCNGLYHVACNCPFKGNKLQCQGLSNNQDGQQNNCSFQGEQQSIATPNSVTEKGSSNSATTIILPTALISGA